eukprot:2247844-Prymnesium_polylepis.1
MGADGKLAYTGNGRGDLIPDYSMVGYYSGDVAPPTAATAAGSSLLVLETIEPDTTQDAAAPKDDAPRIQAAIDRAAAATVDAATGYRGVVRLGAGTFYVGRTLTIEASGI